MAEDTGSGVHVSLDVILPTYNRADLLPKTLDSLLAAAKPSNLKITIYVVDNNSKDTTPEVVEAYRHRFTHSLIYLLERQQGSSAALNAGIRAGTGDLIGMLNDDEEVDARWYQVIADRFSRRPDCAFIGGPYHPNWETPKPEWIAKDFGGIVGWVDGGDVERQYGPGFHGMLVGGNSVIRRCVLEEIGLFNTELGRFDKGLMACEDQELFERLLERKLTGYYVPELIVHHYIPTKRLTKQYHRQWSWGRGMSLGVMARTRPTGVAEVFGIPRWQLRQALSGVPRAIKSVARSGKSHAGFQAELRLWDLVGFIYGRHFRKAPQASLGKTG